MRIREASWDAIGDDLLRILSDDLALVIVRRAAATSDIDQSRDFLASQLALSSRGDHVPGSVIGAFSYLIPSDRYLADCKALNPIVDRLVASTWIGKAQTHLAASLEKRGQNFRFATHNGVRLSRGVFRCWTGDGKYALKPHDDWAQTGFPGHEQLECMSIWPTVVSVNYCIANNCSPPAGSLRIWDFRPEPDDRLGHESPYHGYPYCVADLSRYEAHDVEIRAGDVFFINGRYVHAVVGGQTELRISHAHFIALTRNDSGVISWA